MADEIQRLKTDIALNQAIVFVGTHVSFYTTNGEQETAHWKGLLKHGLQRCHQSGSLTKPDFEAFINKFDSNTAALDDYCSAANRIKDCLKKKSDHPYKSWLLETVGQLLPKRPGLIRAIGELECPILTTNYDSLLTDILQRQALTWNRYCTDVDDHSSEYMKNSIVHLYGYFEEPDTVIFSRGDYKRLSQNVSGLLKLKSLLKTKTLLFIGYDTGSADPYFSNLLKWISQATDGKSSSMYKLVRSNRNDNFNPALNNFLFENIKNIHYGTTPDDLLSFIRTLKSFTPIIRDGLLLTNRRDRIRTKYLHYLIHEYGHVSIFGSSNANINLPLESVYVELKFDPTHPSIKAMQTLEINEEFKRKILSYGFFDTNERNKINRAILERNTFRSETIHRDFMVDQWLNVFLSNRKIFTTTEAQTIKNKINRLKQNIMQKNSFQEIQQYRIQRAYQEFKHFVILGHPGSGKTTLSKWLVVNMAKQCLSEENMLFDQTLCIQKKIPILIPIWKYVDQVKQTQNLHKRTLLQFISENATCNSPFFNDEERKELFLLMMESFIQGHVLVIFEGLDEVPAHVDRSDLMKDINTLLERGIDYDPMSHQLISSIYEQKEINNIKDPHMGNRFIITSRIEGNYFEDINFYIPRLTIENMSNEALQLFCRSYMQCIQRMSNERDASVKQYESNQLYNDINQNKDILQLAINPQLASVIASIYNQCDGQLPERRIDLYEKAIETIIERLVASSNHLSTEYQVNSTMLWSILQEVAQYLHSKVEGLSERILQQIISTYLIEEQKLSSSTVKNSISRLVNMFKYQAGLLNEFGQNSFRFIHRTFQEYLAAKSMIYSNGKVRSEEVIYGNILNKIDVPNWRVPLSMTFAILSKLNNNNDLFNNLLTRLLTNEQTSVSSQSATLLIPFVIIDSLNDMSFGSKQIEFQLIQRLADLLLMDYQNMSSFARLKEHQELIHSYFFKLKQNYEETLTEWLLSKINHPSNLAACANIVYQLKWYQAKFHQIFLNNLHHDCGIWNWPIDTLLRFYSNESKHETISRDLKCRNMLKLNSNMVEAIVKSQDWLRLIAALYGGQKNYNTPMKISEYYEISHFLSLNDKERMPFIFYYEEVWGKEEPAYRMAVHCETGVAKGLWNITPVFEVNAIYKESFLTEKILALLLDGKSTTELVETVRMQINDPTLSINDKVEGLIALVTLGDFNLISTIVQQADRTFIQYFANRIEQLICVLKDPIARCSSSLSKYLLAVYNDIKENSSNYDVNFIDYCKIYLSLSANSGGLSIDLNVLIEAVVDIEEKCDLYAEYWAAKFTGGSDDIRYAVAVILDECIMKRKSKEIVKSFLKISDAVQLYRPVRSYAWPLDTFIFSSNNADDIPIAFFNCLENINTNIAFTVHAIYDVLTKEEYVH